MIVNAKILGTSYAILTHVPIKKERDLKNKDRDLFQIFGRRIINGKPSPYLQFWLVDSYETLSNG